MHGEMDVSVARTRITGEESRDQIGQNIQPTSDINGDGLPELLVDAQYANHGGDNSGAVYLLHSPLPEGELGLEEAAAVLIGEEADSLLGGAIATVGDLNGDGANDLVVSALFATTDSETGGAAYVVLGPITDSLNMADADARIGGTSNGMHLGYAIASTDDQDGDDLPDLILTSPLHELAAGRVSIVAGSSSGSQTLEEAELQYMAGSATGDTLGAAVLHIDLNGDGVGEVLIGAPGRAPLGTSQTGAIYGTSLPLPSDPADSDWILSGLEDGDLLGATILSAGDVDGDGRPDLLISAEGSGEGAGAAYLFLTPPTEAEDASLADTTFMGATDSDALGAVMTVAGDLDGDGTIDLAMGAPAHTSDETLRSHAGRIYIFSSHLRGVVEAEADAEALIDGEATDDEAGTSITTLGDVNDDGNDDLLIGAPYHDTAGPNAGTVFLLTGGSI